MEAYPAILLLASDEEYLPTAARFAIPGCIELRDIASPIDRRRKQAKVGDVAALFRRTRTMVPARCAPPLCESLGFD